MPQKDSLKTYSKHFKNDLSITTQNADNLKITKSMQEKPNNAAANVKVVCRFRPLNER